MPTTLPHTDGGRFAFHLLGGAGGYFKMGRYLQLPATSPTQVLISIANAMGVNVPSFGKDAFAAKSGLSALTG